MSSRNPTELRDELREIAYEGDEETLLELREEARETVDAQRDTLNDIDTKASRILRLNIALIGILVSVLSIGTQLSDDSGSGLTAIEPFVNIYTGLGVGALLFSTAFAALTYTASELDVGISSDNLTQLLRADFSQEEAEELLLKNYAMRINFNRSINIRNIPLLQVTIVLIVSAIVSFVLGIYAGLVGQVPVWLSGATLALIGGFVLTSGLIPQTRRAIRDIREWQ
ncbi:hypothetical protein [Halorhabdus salina]|uniref:hypothetical protein n=1 Tax=Halorhabdus salina TaxID=2750670 RepID=UPI0015EF2B3D|nr:hypothetical protein [Halorhabdus salina]